MQSLDRTSLATTHAGKWLALKVDRQTVIASGGSAVEVLNAARDQGEENPIITRMPQHLRPFLGGHKPSV